MMTAVKIRTIYLIMYMAFAFWRVFYNIYLEDIGLKGSEIGTINTIFQATIFITVVIWGTYADKRGIRPTLRIGVGITAICMFILSYVNNFWILVFYIPFLTFFYHPLGALNDALATQFSNIEKKHSFGTFRLWGSLGWAIASITGGYLFSHFSIKYIFPLSTLLFLMLIPLLSTRKKKHTYTAKFKMITLKELLKNKPLLLFILVISLYGIVCSPVFTYLNLYFTELKPDNNIVGLAYAIMAFSELPLFIIGNRLLKKFGSRTILLMAMCSMALRYLLYGSFPDVIVALSTGLLQGVSLAFFLVGTVDYMKQLIPPEQHATGQSIIWGSYTGLGQTIGNLLIALIIDSYGMVKVMQIWIGIAMSCVLLTIIYFRVYKPISSE